VALNRIELTVGSGPRATASLVDLPGASSRPETASHVIDLAASVTGVPPWIAVSGWLSFW
jgi:hypothetical protein